ncbi:MAG TPA: site-specific DNA-methyltransferase [Stellaceae bacterium]|nr:site-specific DNA-methyltransferase [Stellaceae bacterium]
MKDLQKVVPGEKESVGFSEAYRTRLGRAFLGRIEDALESSQFSKLKGKVDLLITSPPFPLVFKKRYGNESGAAYLEWLSGLAPKLSELLASDGSLVIEVGNAWVKGVPEMSTLPLEALLAFKKAARLHLCQHIICHNPARLPSPAQWVNVDRTRLKDSFTHVWWMSRSESPKADNRRVLVPYGDSMKRLLQTQKYNFGLRPSGHVISEKGFLTDHGGAISANVIDFESSRLPSSLLRFSGTASDSQYRAYCIEQGLEIHPARMPMDLVGFFVQFLTDPDDLVLDPFAGSNTSGAVAEEAGRRWVTVEARSDYVSGSKGRFIGVLRGKGARPKPLPSESRQS